MRGQVVRRLTIDIDHPNFSGPVSENTTGFGARGGVVGMIGREEKLGIGAALGYTRGTFDLGEGNIGGSFEDSFADAWITFEAFAYAGF